MSRDAHIPIFLWIATAALVHILWGWEANQVAVTLESREKVRRFAQSVKRHVRLENQTLEVALLDAADLERLETEENKDGAVVPDPLEEPPDESDLEAPDPSVSERPEAEKPNDTEIEREPPEKKEPPKKDREEQKKTQEVQVVPLDEKRRIAVQQRAADNDQPDNPDADFIADEANHVDKESQARITSSDENSAITNPGTNQAPPANAPGNSQLTEIGQSDEAAGDPAEAPAESPEDGKDDEVSREAEGARAGLPQGGEPAKESHGRDSDGSEEAKPASQGQQGQVAREASEANPDVITSERGSDTLPGYSEAQKKQRARAPVRRREATPNARKSVDLGGFGSLNTTPGGLNPNLNPHMAFSVIGADQLSRERRADGQRRRSKHRGSWTTVGLEKWRSAIENYVATVQPGNQTALNTARRPFASYLNRIHQRLHPVFADDFLPSLDALPNNHVLNRPDMRVFLEIVLSREDGRLVRMGVTRASGSTAFDVGALEAVQKAAPFGPPPSEIVSPDGNVYLHWEFHRNPIYACSTYFARPYLLRMAPTPAPQPPPPERPAEPEEAPLGGERHGRRNVTETAKDG